MANTDTGAAKGKKAAKYSEDLKKKALALWDKMGGRLSARELAEQFGFPQGQLYYWKSRVEGKAWPSGKKKASKRPKLAAKVVRDSVPRRAHSPAAIVRAEYITNDSAEVAALKREIAQLNEEVEILTKTVMLFARRR